MSSQPQFRTGSMVLMTATLICGVLCVLILLPALERQARLGVLYGPPEQSREARTAAKMLSSRFSEFRGVEEQPATAGASSGKAANQRTHDTVNVQQSSVISRTVHTTPVTPRVTRVPSGSAFGSGPVGQPGPIAGSGPVGPSGSVQGQPVFRAAETPQVYVPVTVHPVTVNVDSSGLTSEVARLNQKIEQLVALQESYQRQQTDQQQQTVEQQTAVAAPVVDQTVEENLEIKALRQQLEEVRATLELLRRKEESAPIPEAVVTEIPVKEALVKEAPVTVPAVRVAEVSNDEFEKTDHPAIVQFPEPPAFVEPAPPAFSEPASEFQMEPVTESERELSKPAAPSVFEDSFPEPQLPMAPEPEPAASAEDLTPAVESQPLVEAAPAAFAVPFQPGALEIPVDEVSSRVASPPVRTLTSVPDPARLSGSSISVEQTYQFRSEVLPSPYPLSPVPEIPQGQGSELMPGMSGEPAPDYILPPLEYSPQPFSVHQLPARNPVPHHQDGSERTGKRLIPGTDIEIRFPKIPRPDFESIPRPRLPRLNFSSSVKHQSAGQKFVSKAEGPGLAAKVGESPAVHRGVSALRFVNRPQVVK
ncbi:MAG: hypothetical protein JNL58_21005 [Planctomyces sp.]|nr:hypothetical protein [Planctomyces sp.]